MRVNAGAIPKSLLDRRQWVGWALQGGKKVPFSPLTGKPASVMDPTTWGTFDSAAAMQWANGVGFVLTPTDPFVALDLDSVLTDGVAEPWATELVGRVRSYTEVSQSGKGLHIIATANGVRDSFQKAYDRGHLEVYYRSRYIAMTGDLYPGAPLEPIDCTAAVQELVVPEAPSLLIQPHRWRDVSANDIAEKCAWLAHARDDAATLIEPEWYAMLSVVGRTRDGAATAQEWSKPHPKYDEAETTAKMLRAISAAGPRTCASIMRDFGEDRCSACALLGTIRGPLQAVAPPRGVLPAADPSADPAVLLDGMHRTDKGNADRIIRMHGQDILASQAWVHPLVWDGARWVEGASAMVEYAKDAAQSVFDLLKHPMEAEQAVQHFKWASASESAAKLHSAIDLVRHDERVQASPAAFNADLQLLNCRNAAVDLRTGVARERRKRDWVTELAEVEYDPGAACPEWEKFLASSLKSSAVIRFMQRAAGYSLTGSVREKCLFFLHGPTNSGKTTFARAVSRLLGTYSKPIPQDLLMAKTWANHPTEIANLFGVRMAIASETEEGTRLNESLVKLVTGGDDLTARRMREDFWSFKPTHKLWMLGNHKPTIRGVDDAIWNRIMIVPFEDPHAFDPRLQEKLEAELPGIFNWCIAGAIAWHAAGLAPPLEVTSLREAYRAEQDTVGQFLGETIEPQEGARLSKTDLYRAYKFWAEQVLADRWPMGREAFNRRVEAKGLQTASDGGAYYWEGHTLKAIPLDLRIGVKK